MLLQSQSGLRLAWGTDECIMPPPRLSVDFFPKKDLVSIACQAVLTQSFKETQLERRKEVSPFSPQKVPLSAQRARYRQGKVANFRLQKLVTSAATFPKTA